MTATAIAVPEAKAPAQGRGWSWRLTLSVVVAGFVVLSMVASLGDATVLTNDGTLRDALQLGVPIGLAGLGGLWAERAGIINIGLEGMMILGTWFGAWAGYQWGPWTGVVIGVLGGAAGGLVHAVATVGFGVDHIVSGVSINILALGLTGFFATEFFRNAPGGTDRQSPPVDEIATVSIPGGDWLADLQAHHWFLLSDAAGVVRGALVNLSLLTIVAVALVPLSYLVLWRTGFGLRLRSCGENPTSAESLGVNVYLMKYVAVVLSGALAGLGGVYLVTVADDTFLDGQTDGRGYIGLAAMIFGNWRPGALAAGTLLFGYSDAVRLRNDEESVPALLLFAAIALAALLIRELVRRVRSGRMVTAAQLAPSLLWLAAVACLVAGVRLGWDVHGWGGFGVGTLGVALSAAVGWLAVREQNRADVVAFTGYLVGLVVLAVWYFSDVGVAEQFVQEAPYVVTLLVLAFATQRLRPPAADGVPYRRGDAG